MQHATALDLPVPLPLQASELPASNDHSIQELQQQPYLSLIHSFLPEFCFTFAVTSSPTIINVVLHLYLPATTMAPRGEIPPNLQATSTSGRADGGLPPDLRILHYNDVYHVDPASAEPIGGLARFVTLCREYREGERFKDQPELVTFFSGDAFNPSLESTVTKGKMLYASSNMAASCANTC